MKIFIYLIGWNIVLGIYGIYTAVSTYYYRIAFANDILFYAVKIIEAIIVIWFGHQFLKRTVFMGLGIGKALTDSLKLPKEYIINLINGSLERPKS